MTVKKTLNVVGAPQRGLLGAAKRTLGAMKTIRSENKKIKGLKKQIRAKQQLNSAMRGGGKAGLSASAASTLASDPKKFR